MNTFFLKMVIVILLIIIISGVFTGIYSQSEKKETEEKTSENPESNEERYTPERFNFDIMFQTKILNFNYIHMALESGLPSIKVKVQNSGLTGRMGRILQAFI